MEINIFEKLSEDIFAYLVKRDLLPESNMPFLEYRLEFVIEEVIFWIIIISITIPLHIWKQSVVYVASTLLCRKVMGGWHAPSIWMCQGLSVLTTISVVLLVEKIAIDFSNKDSAVLCVVCLLITTISLLVPSAIPEQLHLTADEKDSFNKRRKTVLILLAMVQLMLIKFGYYKASIYNVMGVFTTLISIGVFYIASRKGGEQNAKKD